MVCETPTGFNNAQTVVVSVLTDKATVYGTVESLFSYDCPVITNVNSGLPNLPKAGASLLTINGFNFGTVNYNAVAKIGPTQCGATTWVTSTTVTCSTPQAGSSLLSQLDVEVVIGDCSGKSEDIAFFDEASRFDPFSDCPCGEEDIPRDRADVRYLSCGPDFSEDLTGETLGTHDRIMLVEKNGVIVDRMTSGMQITSSGQGAVREKLFSFALDSFKFEATFQVSIELEGDFNQDKDASMIIGIGNGTHFFGATKNSQYSEQMGSIIHGTYSDDAITSISKNIDLGLWAGRPMTSNPSRALLNITSYVIPGQRTRGLTARFANGDRDASAVERFPDFTLLPETETGLGLNVLAFRENKDHMFTLNRLKISLEGCDPV
jgi:hypothetical protein